MKKLANIAPEGVFTYGGKRFVVMEHTEKGVFCLLEQSEEESVFHSGDDAPRNDYRKATLRKKIEEEWLEELFANGAKKSDLIPFELDLRETDGSEGYGVIEVLAAPLTLWQNGKYKDIIPTDENGYWLATPWKVRSPDTDDTSYAWRVGSDGDWYYYYVFVDYDTDGIRPALMLSSDLLVSTDDEDDAESCGECANYNVDLSRVETGALLKEIERRLSEGEQNVEGT